MDWQLQDETRNIQVLGVSYYMYNIFVTNLTDDTGQTYFALLTVRDSYEQSTYRVFCNNPK